jgi:hypothetical protein
MGAKLYRYTLLAGVVFWSLPWFGLWLDHRSFLSILGFYTLSMG